MEIDPGAQDMAVRRLIISDLHFGSAEALLAAPAGLERIEPELAWADELVINGDLFELVFTSLPDAVAAARPFLALVSRHVRRVHYLPGNHDHHLVSLAGDERRFAEVLGSPAPTLFEVAPAERLLRSLCPGTDVICAYPVCELDGLRITHGHYIAPHVGSSEWRLMDRLAWRLTGEVARPDRLTVADYEGLIAPLYELMYEIANLPSGKRAQQQFERWLSGIAAIARAPQRASRQITGLAQAIAGRASSRELAPTEAPADEVVQAMQAVCHNLEIAPGTVVFGHTHLPLDGVRTPDGAYRLYNSGSWVWDRRLREAASYRDSAWPGTVLRATGGDVELRSLLADCDENDLRRLLGVPVEPPPRRRGRPQLVAVKR
jgi:UDP-2,3-diacylglucosamine pyrophosphatase LpxH